MILTYRFSRDPNSLYGFLSTTQPATDALNAVQSLLAGLGTGDRIIDVVDNADGASTELTFTLADTTDPRSVGARWEHVLREHGVVALFLKKVVDGAHDS